MRDLVAARAAVRPGRVERVAIISMHTCPLDQPGIGDSGGLNVYVRAVAGRLAEAGLRVDVFTRAAGPEQHVVDVDPGVRVIHLEAGPDAPVDKEQLPTFVWPFLRSLLRFASDEVADGRVPAYDVVHTHYWLSGWVGRLTRDHLGIPLVHSFHTLGRVKNRALAPGEDPEPAGRLEAEERIARTADCLLAPTPNEAEELVRELGAHPDRVRVVSPGVDTDRFRPGDSEAARQAIGLAGRRVLLFAGRLQPLKQPDLAIGALADLVARRPDLSDNLLLLVLGGPSGRSGVSPDSLRSLAGQLGVSAMVEVRDPVPHTMLPDFYRAAEAVLIPSRTESFGLVAMEAQACGTPVVATDTDGLRAAVRDGATGILVRGGTAEAFSRALEEILTDSAKRATLGEAAARFARHFDWRRAAAGILASYEALVAPGIAEGTGL